MAIQHANTQSTPSTVLKRDGYIDFFKGLLILWVIHIHTVFWSGTNYIEDNVRQVSLLVDVTTFFFISGYLTKPTGLLESFKKVGKQFKILYLNYLGLSLALLVPLSVAYFFRKDLMPDFTQAILFMLSVLKLEGEGDVWAALPVYRGSFWYLWVYFSLLAVLPFLISCCGSRKSRLAVLGSLLVLLYVSIQFSLHVDFLLTDTSFIFFYGFVYLLGLTYRAEHHLISTRWLLYSFLTNCIASLILFFHIDNSTLALQAEKFPPSFKYLVYSLLLMHVFCIVQRVINYPGSEDTHWFLRFLEWCGKNSYFIYLIQGIITSIPLYFSGILTARMSIPAVYVIILIFNISMTLLSTLIYLTLKDKLLHTLKPRLPAKQL